MSIRTSHLIPAEFRAWSERLGFPISPLNSHHICSTAELPPSGNVPGDTAFTSDTETMWIYAITNAWVPFGSSNLYYTAVTSAQVGLSDTQYILPSKLLTGGLLTLVGSTAYFVYLGLLTAPLIPKFVEFQVTTPGVGVQTAECGFYSTPLPPNKTAQTLTRLVSTDTLDSMLSIGVKRNTTPFATQIGSGVQLWAGIRLSFTVTNPIMYALGIDMGQGQSLSLVGASSIHAASTVSATIPSSSILLCSPDLRGSLV